MDLGLERAGMKCVWQVEIDPYARRVLEKHWPDVPRWDDVRTFPPPDGDWTCDLIAGGFPCQDISLASANGTGIVGQRSGLWKEFARVVETLRPKYVFVENVPAIRHRGLALVLQDLWSLGFDAEWHCIPACAVGAPHERDRIWIVAYVTGVFGKEIIRREQDRYVPGDDANATCDGRRTGRTRRPDPGYSRQQVAVEPFQDADFDGEPLVRSAIARGECHAWTVEPGVVRMVHGVPNRVDRLRCLGNAVVPQVAEWIGRRIMDRHKA
jgi:DNA (cytosine-5)-methyltransferase 1